MSSIFSPFLSEEEKAFQDILAASKESANTIQDIASPAVSELEDKLNQFKAFSKTGNYGTELSNPANAINNSNPIVKQGDIFPKFAKDDERQSEILKNELNRESGYSQPFLSKQPFTTTPAKLPYDDLKAMSNEASTETSTEAPNEVLNEIGKRLTGFQQYPDEQQTTTDITPEQIQSAKSTQARSVRQSSPELSSLSSPRAEDQANMDLLLAQENDAKARLISDLSKSAEIFGRAISRQELNPEVMKMLTREGTSVQQYKDQQAAIESKENRALKKEELKLRGIERLEKAREIAAKRDEERALNDPNSPISQMMRSSIKSKMPELSDSISDNMTAAQLLKTGFKLDPLDQYRADLLATKNRGLELRGENLGLQKDRFAHAKKEKDELSDKQAETVNSLRATRDGLGSIRKQFPKVTTGPIEGRVIAMKELFGVDDPKGVAFKSEIASALAKYIKGISGTAVAVQEYDRLEKILPSPNDTPANFLAKLDRFENELKISEARVLDSFQKQGKDIDTYLETGIDPRITAAVNASNNPTPNKPTPNKRTYAIGDTKRIKDKDYIRTADGWVEQKNE
jgi:hypothetical protein